MKENILSELKDIIKNIEDNDLSENISERLISLSLTVMEESVKNRRINKE